MQGSTEQVTCKKGLYLLRAALPSAAIKEAPWSVFLSLYELIDEYPLHLIEVRFRMPDIRFFSILNWHVAFLRYFQ